MTVDSAVPLELVRRLREAEDRAERADKRADFYEERAAAGIAALEDVAKAICRTLLPIGEQQPLLALIGEAQRRHGEAGAAIMKRLREAEAIVTMLAVAQVHRETFPRHCYFCGERLDSPIDKHDTTCLTRRAVDATRRESDR